MTSTSRWLIGITVVLIVLATLHWYLNSRPTAYFNQYGNQTASSTDSAGLPQAGSDKATPSPVTSTPSNITNTNNTDSNSVKNFMHTITIETNKGTIVFETYDADAPLASKNFITLAEKGFYNNLIFHRIIKGFMIQGGDPLGNGRGGPGYKFADELDPNTASYKAGYVRGTVAMANSGPDTNGSQFFIMHNDYALPHSYTIFGKVVSGLEVVDAIANTPVGAQDKPTTDVVMKKVTVTTK